MSLYPKFRDVHLWVGLILLVPLVIIGGTGVMLNHERLLGLKPELPKAKKEPKVATSNVAASSTATTLASVDKNAAERKQHGSADKNHAKEHAKKQHVSQLKLEAGLWQTHAASIDEALAAAEAEWGQVSLERVELRDENDYGLVVKVKASHEVFQPDREIVWSVASHEIVMKRGDKAEGIQWNKVVHDLHTGKFFSDMYGFWWSDLTGIAILALSATGVVLYIIPLSKKWNKKKQPATARKPLPAGMLPASAKSKLATAPVAASPLATGSNAPAAVAGDQLG